MGGVGDTPACGLGGEVFLGVGKRRSKARWKDTGIRRERDKLQLYFKSDVMANEDTRTELVSRERKRKKSCVTWTPRGLNFPEIHTWTLFYMLYYEMLSVINIMTLINLN